jgi:hypothetical protein
MEIRRIIMAVLFEPIQAMEASAATLPTPKVLPCSSWTMPL